MRKLTACLLVALLGGALLAACGSSKSSTHTITTGGQASATGSGTGATSSGATAPTGSSGARGSAAAPPSPRSSGAPTSTTPPPQPTSRQLTACLQYARALTTISASVKAKLEKACQQPGTNQASPPKTVPETSDKTVHETLRNAEREAREICEAYFLRRPPSASRERALNICRRTR